MNQSPNVSEMEFFQGQKEAETPVDPGDSGQSNCVFISTFRFNVLDLPFLGPPWMDEFLSRCK